MLNTLCEKVRPQNSHLIEKDTNLAAQTRMINLINNLSDIMTLQNVTHEENLPNLGIPSHHKEKSFLKLCKNESGKIQFNLSFDPD